MYALSYVYYTMWGYYQWEIIHSRDVVTLHVNIARSSVSLLIATSSD